MRDIPIRCPSFTYGIAVNATGEFRARCRGKFCRGPEGTVSFHVFDLATGSLCRTTHEPYRDPRALLGQGDQK